MQQFRISISNKLNRSNSISPRPTGQGDTSVGLSPRSRGQLDDAVGLAKQLAGISAYGLVNMVDAGACESLIVNDEGLKIVCTKESKAKYERNAVDFVSGEEFVATQRKGCRKLPWTRKCIKGPEAVVGEYVGAAEGVGLKGIASTDSLISSVRCLRTRSMESASSKLGTAVIIFRS